MIQIKFHSYSSMPVCPSCLPGTQLGTFSFTESPRTNPNSGKPCSSLKKGSHELTAFSQALLFHHRKELNSHREHTVNTYSVSGPWMLTFLTALQFHSAVWVLRVIHMYSRGEDSFGVSSLFTLLRFSPPLLQSLQTSLESFFNGMCLLS